MICQRVLVLYLVIALFLLIEENCGLAGGLCHGNAKIVHRRLCRRTLKQREMILHEDELLNERTPFQDEVAEVGTMDLRKNCEEPVDKNIWKKPFRKEEGKEAMKNWNYIEYRKRES